MGISLRNVQRASRLLASALAVGLPLGLWGLGATPLAVGAVPEPWDKLAHMGVYAVLACAAGFASRRRGFDAMALGFGVAVLVGAADEVWQSFLPGRAADWDDFAADAVGAALGTCVLAVRVRIRQWVQAHGVQ